MFATRIISNFKITKNLIQNRNKLPKLLPSICLISNSNLNKNKSQNDELGDMASKYKIFKEEDSEIVIDIYEERLKYQNLLEEEEEKQDEFAGINLERGLNGVFEIEDLVDVLKRENAQNIFVALVPQEIQYVDYICVVTAKSQRHMKAICQFVRRVYKQKRHKGDIIPKLEGGNSASWFALDLGNIALHIFTKEARDLYDLETLWSVGPKYDEETNKKDLIAEMLERHSIYLSDLKPAT